jgi:C-terminal processing protease CtpA/Prc
MNSSLADIYMESKPRYSFNNNANLQEIKLNKHYSLNGDYGLVIRGGRDLNSSLQVVKVIEGSLAALDGRLNAGDEIIQVNGVSAEQMNSKDLDNAFRSTDQINLLIRKAVNFLPVDTAKNGILI